MRCPPRVVESSASPAKGKDVQPIELTLVSYNIHSGIGTDGRFDLHRVAEVLSEINADILALQEVGDFRGRVEKEAHPEDLAENLGLHMAFGPNVVRNGRRFGNA